MARTNYNAIAKRLEGDWRRGEDDVRAIMALLHYEVATHGRLGLACRPCGVPHWQSLPDFRSADSAALWLCPGNIDIGWWDTIENDSTSWSTWFTRADGEGTPGRGRSKTLGSAMWAAFVRAHQ